MAKQRLTAMDIESQEFKRKLRGYDEEQVRLYLKAVGDEVERLNLETAQQREQMGQLRRRLEELSKREKSLQDAFIAAKSLSDEMVQRSRDEAELLVREARLKSERMVQQAQDQLARIEDEIARAQFERSTFERELRSAVEGHLELLELRVRERKELDGGLRVLPRMTGEAG